MLKKKGYSHGECMRFFGTAVLGGILLLNGTSVLAQYATPYDYILSAVRHRDLNGLKNLIANGYPVDAPNQYGDTALCQTILYKDYPGFELLITQGANPKHPCTQKISTYNRRAFMASQPLMGTYFQGSFENATVAEDSPLIKKETTSDSQLLEWGAWGAGIVGGVALLSASDSSSGSSGSGGNDSGNTDSGSGSGGNDSGGDDSGGGSGGDDSNDGPISAPVDPFVLTNEYTDGHFLSQINASAAYEQGHTGYVYSDGVVTSEKIKVGVIDTGVYEHDDLKGNLATGFNYDYGPCRGTDTTNCWMYYENNGNPVIAIPDGEAAVANKSPISITAEAWDAYQKMYPDDYDWDANKTLTTPLSGGDKNHGTLVAGTIAATKNDAGIHGVAYNAEIIPVRYDLMSSYSEAVESLIGAGARVINFSLGLVPGDDTRLEAQNVNAYNFSKLMNNFEYVMYSHLDAFKAAAEKSTVLVFAAGNDGKDEPGIDRGAPMSTTFNGSLDNLVINVVAVDENNKITDYSTRCGSTSHYCLAAPGGTDSTPLISTDVDNGYGYWKGTSAAAPVVSGAVALLMASDPTLKSQDVVEILFRTATDLGDSAIYGHGLLNLEAAFNPVGEQALATGSSTADGRESATRSKITLPASYTNVVNALPQTLSVLDDYNRSFAVNTGNFIRVAHHNPDTFRNALHRFTQHDAEGRIELSPRLSFAFNKAASIDAKSGLGALNMSYQLSPNQTLNVFFTEDGAYGRGSFFDKPLVNPFGAMDNAYGFEHVYKLTSRTNFKMGFATGENGLIDGNEDLDIIDKKQSFTVTGSMDYNVTDNTAFGFVGGILREEKSMLGLYGTGGFKTPDTNTYYMGVTARMKPTEKLTLQAAYYYGLSNPERNSSFMKTGRLISDSFAVDARYQLNDTDVAGIQFSSPLRIRSGSAEFDLPVGRDFYSHTIYRETVKASLKPSAREYDMSVYYTKSISDALRIKSQAGLRLNPDHIEGAAPDYNMLFSLDWKY